MKHSAQRDHLESIRREEEEHIDEIPDGEREEIRQIFQEKGFRGDTLKNIVNTITNDRRLWIDTMLREEHGLNGLAPSPIMSSVTTFAAFVVVGAVPLMPFLFDDLVIHHQFIGSSILAAVMFFLIGTLKSVRFGRPVLGNGVKTLLTGGTAASLAFVTGFVLRRLVENGA